MKLFSPIQQSPRRNRIQVSSDDLESLQYGTTTISFLGLLVEHLFQKAESGSCVSKLTSGKIPKMQPNMVY